MIKLSKVKDSLDTLIGKTFMWLAVGTVAFQATSCGQYERENPKYDHPSAIRMSGVTYSIDDTPNSQIYNMLPEKDAQELFNLEKQAILLLDLNKKGTNQEVKDLMYKAQEILDENRVHYKPVWFANPGVQGMERPSIGLGYESK